MMVIDDFKQKTGVDLTSFFSSVTSFFSSDYQTLVQYYTGQISTISSVPYQNLQSLQNQLSSIFSTFQNFKNSLGEYKYYELLDLIEQIDSRVQTAQNINRWARSSATSVAYAPVQELNYTLSEYESLEKVAQNVQGSQNPEDDWYSIAVRNNLEEEQYTSEGGTNIQVTGNKQSVYAFPLNSVVDVINGKSVYGKDIQKELTIDPVTQDVVVLGYDDTINQACQILGSLKKNSNPDFRDSGLQKSLVVGGTKATLNFPVIQRQFADTFATDDTIKDFTITSIGVTGNVLNMAYSVQTRLQEVLQLETTI
jgi:hypothetical protein